VDGICRHIHHAVVSKDGHAHEKPKYLGISEHFCLLDDKLWEGDGVVVPKQWQPVCFKSLF